MIDYKSEVKKIYPDAWLEKDGFGYIYVVHGREGLSHAFLSEMPAWKSAYQRLKQQGKIIQ